MDLIREMFYWFQCCIIPTKVLYEDKSFVWRQKFHYIHREYGKLTMMFNVVRGSLTTNKLTLIKISYIYQLFVYGVKMPSELI